MDTINFLTWNYQKGSNALKNRALTDLVDENDIDILILQESYDIDLKSLLIQSHEEIPTKYYPIGQGVRIFLRKNTFEYSDEKRSNRNKLFLVSLRKLSSPDWFTLAAVHFYSKRNRTERMQMWGNVEIVKNILEYETKYSTRNKTIIGGDLNLMPFEANLSDPTFFRSHNSSKMISFFESFEKASLTNHWFNPMWHFLGDRDVWGNTREVTGTYYRNTEDETINWNLIDGFIVRSSLMNQIDYANSEILTRTQNDVFLKSNITNRSEMLLVEEFSDHLPVKFSINI